MATASALTDNRFIIWGVTKLSLRMKRLIYLASLAAVANGVNQGEDLDRELVVKLNTLLQIAESGASSLRLPIQMSSVLWKNRSVIQDELNNLKSTVSACDINSIKTIINMTPAWIRYSDDKTTQEDISRLFCPENNLIQ